MTKVVLEDKPAEESQPTTTVMLLIPGKVNPAELAGKLGTLNEYAVSMRINDPSAGVFY